MKERPILFSGPMVQAILQGAKTQTRRMVKPQPAEPVDPQSVANAPAFCPYGAPGDRLWVRERWGLSSHTDETEWHSCGIKGASDAILGHWKVQYAADWGPNQECCHWRPSIHMPRWASRITLEVTSVRVERLQEITEEDAKAEGVTPLGPPLAPDQPIIADAKRRINATHPHTLAFAVLWDEINGDAAGKRWTDSPWVWVVEFKEG